MQKQSYKIRKFINPDIKVGNKVKLIDGSGLSVKDTEHEDVYIVFAYPVLTGSHERLKDIEAYVEEIDIEDIIIPSFGLDTAYLQDIVVKIGEGYFRTCSKFVKNI